MLDYFKVVVVVVINTINIVYCLWRFLPYVQAFSLKKILIRDVFRKVLKAISNSEISATINRVNSDPRCGGIVISVTMDLLSLSTWNNRMCIVRLNLSIIVIPQTFDLRQISWHF